MALYPFSGESQVPSLILWFLCWPHLNRRLSWWPVVSSSLGQSKSSFAWWCHTQCAWGLSRWCWVRKGSGRHMFLSFKTWILLLFGWLLGLLHSGSTLKRRSTTWLLCRCSWTCSIDPCRLLVYQSFWSDLFVFLLSCFASESRCRWRLQTQASVSACPSVSSYLP